MWAIFDGTGTYRIGNLILKPGATEVTDEATIQRIHRLNIPWITLSETREIPPVEADAPVPVTPITFDKFRGRDEKWYFHYPVGSGQTVEQSAPFETEEEVDAAIVAARKDGRAPRVPLAAEVATPEAPLSGQLTAEDVQRTEWGCRGADCDHAPFKSENARTNHEHIKHPELFGGPARPSAPLAPPPPPATPAPPRPEIETAGVPNPNPDESDVPPVNAAAREREEAVA